MTIKVCQARHLRYVALLRPGFTYFGVNVINLAKFSTILLLAAPSMAQSQEGSLADMSCREYRQKILSTPAKSEEGQKVNSVHLWLYGYTSGRLAHPVMSVQDSKLFVVQLMKTCELRPEISLVEAAEIAGKHVFDDTN